MPRQIYKFIFVLSILCMSYSVVYAEDMNLIYDGKSHLYTNKPIYLYIDGNEIMTTVMPPIQLEGNILVPVSEVFTSTGAHVEWRDSEKSVYIYDDVNLIVLKVNSNEAWVNGENKKMNIPAKIINDKVMIPIRFISESLGYQVNWVQEDSTVYISTQKEVASPPDLGGNDIEDFIQNETGPSDLGDSQEMGDNSQLGEDGGLEMPSTDAYALIENTYFSCEPLESSLILNGIEGLQTSMITYEENENVKQIVVNLNGDYSAYLPDGYITPNDGWIDEIRMTTVYGNTRLMIKTSTVRVLMLEEREGGVYLRLAKPSEKYDRIIVIDAGHGDNDPGASSNGLNEKDINLALSRELVSLLEADPSIKVYATRHDDTFLELMERVDFSNQIEPDLFISIHVNSYTSNVVNGTETYYTEDPDTRNKIFATMVQQALINEFGTTSRGVKNGKYVVTRYTDAPAILIEIGFITNDSDRAMMTSEGFEERYARTVYNCIVNYYSQGLND